MAATLKQWRDKKMTWKVYEAQQLGLPLDQPKNQLHLFDENLNQQLWERTNQIETEKQTRLVKFRKNFL